MNTGNLNDLYIANKVDEEHQEIVSFFKYIIDRSKQMHKKQSEHFTKVGKLEAENKALKDKILELESLHHDPNAVLFNPVIHMLKQKLPFTKEVWLDIGKRWTQASSLPKKERPSVATFVNRMNELHKIDNFTRGYLQLMRDEGCKETSERCM